MSQTGSSPWLHRFAVLTAASTLCLIWLGGLVTSLGAGMAVPDWPTSYGYNMFYFPLSQWVGGIFYEHTHRLLAAVIGLLTSILAGWIWTRGTTGWRRWAGLGVMVVLVGLLGHRGSGQAEGGLGGVPPHFRALAVVMPFLLLFGVVQAVRRRGALEWLALTAFFAVILQGVLGGLRVAAMKPQLGILHGTLAQLFFVLLCVIALRTSPWWQRTAPAGQGGAASGRPAGNPATGWRWALLAVTVLILGQLMLGATMRHQHAGLAISDFPLAHGRLWPQMDEAAIQRYNQERMEVRATNPITAFQVGLQMAHRVMALAIFVGVAWVAGAARRRLGPGAPLARLTTSWFALILLQVLLGALTIWTNKAADIATAHVAVGALSFATGVLGVVVAWRAVVPAAAPAGTVPRAAMAGAPVAGVSA
ncbi:MAG: Heme synthase [Verrucomicrobiota bacterium]|jgi:cytochrome c oxidase assembly protein subunit 15